MVVHSGGTAAGFANSQEGDTHDTDGISLFHVKGTDPVNTRAAQVEEKATSLNSGDCFVLLTPAVMYVWKGSASSDVEFSTAQKNCGDAERQPSDRAGH